MIDPRRALSTARWQRLRRTILNRDGWRCSRCKSARRLQVHHIIEKHVRHDLIFEPTNLQTVCAPCHDAHHRPDVHPEIQEWRTYQQKEIENDRSN